MEDALKVGVMVAFLHLSFSHSGHAGSAWNLGTEEITECILDGVRITLIIAAKILVMDHVRDL